ncbi:tandem-95 repeat protein, partial [Vibrio alginolyticus]|uniref:tandem-95 repeat protein n=1 Tax=Vibrio alginolyticus TaxID=663 RepID=UPI00211A85A1
DNGDGTFSFAPNENFNGDVSLDVVVTDEDGATASTNANIDVLPINDAPVSGDLAYSVDEDGSITLSQEQLLAQAGDVDGDDLTASNLTVDGNATVVANDDGSFTITPDADFNGDIDLSFDITDGDATIQATADLTVNPVNDLPTVGQPQFVTQEDTSFTFTEEQLLQNAGDIDGDNLTVENVASDSGTLVDNGDGTYTFAPNENFDGNVNVTFDVNDGTATVPAEANIDVQSVVDMPELSIASDLVIASDNFESGSNGWNANTESSQGFETGDMLGRIGGTGGDEAVSKTYDIPSDVNEVNISFSFYEIDSWDGESFQIFVGGEQLTTLENSAFRTQDGTTTLYDSDGNEVGEVIHGASQREGFSGWNDQAHQINLTVPVEDGELQLGFGSTLNQSTWDESFGIDNIEITVADADYQIIGTEDTPVPLDIDAALTDTDGSENLSILIEDVPEGSSLSAGVDNGDGTWSLQPGELEGLEFIPSADFNGDVTLTVNATSMDVDTGTTATATQDVTIHISPTNDAPEVTGDISAVTAEDNSITLTQEQLLEHAVDIDGDDLSAINLSTNDENATVEMNEDGSFTITPSENFYGDIEFTYDVTDGEEVVAAGLDLTVTPVNDAPEPQDQAFTVGEDGILTFTDADLLTGATDVEGDNLTVEGVTYTGADGVLTDNGDGTYSFAPNENFNGDVNFTFDVSDGTDTVTANIDVTVTPENDPPVAGSTSYTVHEDNSITISDEQLLANSSDIEGDVAISSVSYSGNDGVLEINGDGTYTFSPNENFTGDVSLDAVVVDEDGAVDTTTAGITVLEVNDPPIAGVTSYTIDEDEVITISAEQLLANSSDIEGEVALDSVSYSGSEGIFTDNGDGTFSFAPNQNFNGEVNLDVVVVDEDGATASTTANIDVLPINDAPVSGDLAYSVDEDNSITLSQEQLLAQATDVEGDALTASNLVVDGDATVTANDDGSFTITPDANFNGDIDITFDINDGSDTIVATADLTVNPVNDLPQPEDQAFTIGEDGVLTFTDQDLLDGATDIDGDDLSVEGVTYTGADGVLTDNGDGTYSFAPNENFNGDVNFTFDVSDGTDTVTANIDVSVTPENDPPVAGSTSYTVHEDNSITISDEQLLANSSDIEGDVSIDSVSYSGNDGVLEINGDGTYTFSPNENFNGEVSLDVVVVDEDGATDSTTAGITVLEVNDPPIAGPTAYTIDEDQVLTFSESQVLLNASDVEGDVELVSISYDGPDGIFSVNGDGTCSFAPNENFNGQVSLDVTIRDEDGAEVDTYITVDVLPINDAPVSGNLAYNVDEDNTITLSQEQLLSQASDVDGDDLVAENLLVDGNATVTANDDGSFTITPDANFNGDIDITFDISDGSDTLVATADLTVNPVNDLPQPEDQAFTIGEDGVLLFTDEDLLDGATDIDGDDLSVEGVSYTGADGVLTDNGDGTYSFAPNENFNGDVNFTFDVSDGTDTVTANIDVSVTPENDPPVAGSTSYTVHEDNSITISNEQLLANSSDVEGEVAIDSVSYSGVDGVFQDNGDGTYTFSPNENFNGEVSLDVVVVDEDGATDSTTAGITVLEVNDPPIAGATSYSVNEDEVIIFTKEQLLAQSSDVEGDVSLESVSYSGSDGILTANDDGTYSFAPNENFNGGVSLDVVVADEDGATATTNANIDVLPVNDAPVSGDLAYSVDEDGSITLSQEQLLAQAGDVDSDNLEAVNLTAVANATVVENQDGSFTITPDANFNGDIDLSFDLIDNDGASVEVGVDLTVNPINDAPQSTPVNIAGTEDTTILITQDMLLANATDIDNTYDELSAVDLVIDEQYGDLLDNGDGTWSFTPAENFNGDVPMSFGVSDGDLVTPVEGNLNVEAVNDAPEAPTIQMQGEEDVVMVIDPAYIADQVTDLDGDEISVESITVRAPANATLTQQPDGMYHLVTTQDFNGLVELGYTATDGEEVVEGSLNVDVIPVNDAPFNVGNAFMATDEDGAFTFDAGDLMNLFGDIDTENLVVSRIITAEGEDGGEVTDNGDGTWTFTPTGDFAGVSDLQVVVSDGEFETVLDVPVFVRPVADGAVITTDHDGPLVFGEDETGHLGLNVGLIDDSETLSNLVMTGFPVGFEVTDGVNTVTITEPGQYIDLNEWDISDLQMTPPADFNGEFFVTVTATTVDYGDEPEEFEDGIDSGDFETLAGEPVVLTADDLIGLAENVDADAGDEVKFVHLADRSQGEIVDNGDGTWTFNPAPGFTGEADIAYVIDKDGVLHDEQTGVVVKEDAPQENASPEIDSISTTEMAADGTLSFTNDDMLSTLSDAEGDSLSIESVSLMEGQGVIETDNQGNYQFTPAEGYTGDVQVGFIATDGENRIESFFNVDIQGEGETTTSEGYALADDGSLTLTEAQLIDELGISPSAEVLDVADANDAGFFAKSGDEEWTYWPNDDFDGNLAMDVQVNDNGEVSTQNLSIQVADDSAQSDEPQIQTAQASSEQQVGEAQQPEEQAANGADSEEESAADVTAAPGDTISISVPDEVSGNESVDYAEMSGLPDGASVSNALDNGDGSFTLSGNLNQPVSVDLPEGYEGTSEIQFQGYDELGSAVEGASGTVEVEVDDQYTMQGSAQDQQPDMAGMESGGSDWTSAGGQDQGVDFTDDSGSFDSDTQTGTDQGNDFDQSSM